MARRIISADAILKMKGIEKKSFDTSDFNEVVHNFFLNNDAKAKLLLVGDRFIEWDYPPEKDFIDITDINTWMTRVDDPKDPFDFYSGMAFNREGLIRPAIVVDEPFLNNAAHYLRTICGFNVKKFRKLKRTMYDITLPI